MSKKTVVDPFSKKEIDIKTGKPVDGEIDIDIVNFPQDGESYLAPYRTNFVNILGNPWKAKHDLTDRGIAILDMIEKNAKLLFDHKWMGIYERIYKTTQDQLEKLSSVWKDLQNKESSKETLKAFQNFEVSIEFLSQITNGESDVLLNALKNKESEVLIKHFLDFLKEKGLFA